MDHYLKFKQI